jgi:hypothetical protein
MEFIDIEGFDSVTVEREEDRDIIAAKFEGAGSTFTLRLWPFESKALREALATVEP